VRKRTVTHGSIGEAAYGMYERPGVKLSLILENNDLSLAEYPSEKPSRRPNGEKKYNVFLQLLLIIIIAAA
jgi:hypothetical protein